MVKEAYTGRLLEGEMLGKPEIQTPTEVRDYLNYQASMRNVRRTQSPDTDPSDPQPEFANDLHYEIADRLGLLDIDDGMEKLRFYSALGTQLDRFHSVDAFFDYDSEHGTVTVTLDVTLNQSKDEYRADVIVQVDEDDFDRIDSSERYLHFVSTTADEIAEKLTSKVEEAIRRERR